MLWLAAGNYKRRNMKLMHETSHHSPGPQVNHGYVFIDVANYLGAVEVEKGNLVVGLVEFRYGYDLVPDE